MLKLTYEEALETQARQLGYHSRKYVPGMEQEDVAQELRIVLWKALQTFDPMRGSFMNVVEVAFRNKMEHLRRVGRRQVSPVERLLCKACGTGRPVAWRPTCTCGSRAFAEVRGTATSLDMALQQDVHEEGGAASRFEGRYLATSEPGYAVVEFNVMRDGITP